MQTLTARFEIVTPMFIGGAHSDDPPDIRPPSVKGALRFWWRALQWRHCLNQSDADPTQALHLLHQQEAALFGLAIKEQQYGQGQVQLKIQAPEKQKPLQEHTLKLKQSSGLTYLLGQGLYHYKNGLLKSALDAHQTFELVLKIKPAADIDSLIQAVMAFGLLGGLGSRGRKGWGSVAIRSLVHHHNHQDNVLPVPQNINQYQAYLTDLFKDLPKDLPPYTAVSKHTRMDISVEDTQPLAVLNHIGTQMQQYRSYGQNQGQGHQVNGQPAEQNFKDDHDLVLAFANGQPIQNHPQRAVFGLPHNYFFSGTNKQVDVNAQLPGGKASRRASPLFIHLHTFANQAIAVQTLLPAQFLPSDVSIQLKDNKHSKLIPSAVDWNVITTYMDRFASAKRIL
jgi:CRISPR-associated protein Cmr1